MDPAIRIRIIYNVKNFYAIHFKFGDKFLTSLNKVNSRSEYEYLLYNQRKSTFILSSVFGICYGCHNLIYLNNKISHKETLPVTEITNFTSESLAFHNKLLNNAHSISDINLSLFRRTFLDKSKPSGKVWHKSIIFK